MAEAYNGFQCLKTHPVPPRVHEVEQSFFAILHRANIASPHTADRDATLMDRTLRPLVDQIIVFLR